MQAMGSLSIGDMVKVDRFNAFVGEGRERGLLSWTLLHEIQYYKSKMQSQAIKCYQNSV